MNGPYRADTGAIPITASQGDWETRRLIRQQCYCVIKPFLDSDGDQHQVGEEWIFVYSMFSRLDDELTIRIRTDLDEEWEIPLIWKPEAQQGIIEMIDLERRKTPATA